MQIEQITDVEIWEKAVKELADANFLQSWYWGEFQAALGKQVVRLMAVEDGRPLGLAQAILEPAKRGSYLAVAGGPLFQPERPPVFAQLLESLATTGRDLGAVFIRLRPQVIETAPTLAWLHSLGLQPAPMHLTADLTLRLDLTQSTDQLLAQMRKNTRYSIRKADSLQIKTWLSQDPAEIKDFYQTQLELAHRHNFVPFSYDWLHQQFQIFASQNMAALIHAATFDNQLLASAFVIFYHQEAVYHYGVSTPANQKLPGSYAVQWRAIQEAQARGMHYYNLWGIAPPNQLDHRFAGVSLFKRGFGGEEVKYLSAHDLPLSSRYLFTKTFENLRRIRRKL